MKDSKNNSSVKNYMKHPHEVLTENRINIAKAKEAAMSDGFLNTMGDIGNMAMAWGMNNGGMDALGEVAGKAFGKPVEGLAMGGTNKSQNVKVDDGEIIETPDGQLGEVKGNPNEVDGVDASLPIGTKVFSDMLSKHGETMAERKINREKKLSKLQRLLEKKPSDTLVKNSIKRVAEANEKEEAEDMAIQEQMTAMAQMLNKAEGFLFGTGLEGTPGINNEDEDGISLSDRIGAFGETYGDPLTLAADNLQSTIDSTAQEHDIDMTPEKERQPFNILETMTGGDVLGIAGNFHAMNKLKKNTLNSRATDTPNVNAYKEFGKDGIEEMDAAKDHLKTAQDVTKNEIRQNAAANKRSGRIGARGMATQRANDLAVEQGANDAMGKASAQFAQQMMQMMSRKAQMEMMQDRMVMQGEDQRDMRDRADKDAHYSNMAQDIASYSTGLQQTGKDVNQIAQNELIMKLMTQISPYFNMNAKGDVTNKETNTED